MVVKDLLKILFGRFDSVSFAVFFATGSAILKGNRYQSQGSLSSLLPDPLHLIVPFFSHEQEKGTVAAQAVGACEEGGDYQFCEQLVLCNQGFVQ